MPSLDTIRAEAEGKLDRILARLDRRHRALVLGAVETYGSVQAIPQSVWREIQRDIEDDTAAALLALIILSDEWTRGQIVRQGVTLRGPGPRAVANYGTVAAIRAQQLAAERLLSIQRRLADGLAEVQADATKSIQQAVGGAFDAAARERQAVTTTTDTISLGQRGAGRAGDGASTADGDTVVIDMIWRTEQDARVCPICAPLDRTGESLWGSQFPNGPPAHPNCRCSLSPTVTKTNHPTRPVGFGPIRPAYTIGV